MTVTINYFTAGASAKVYQSVSRAAPAAAANATISGGVISGLSIAANSITLLVVGHQLNLLHRNTIKEIGHCQSQIRLGHGGHVVPRNNSVLAIRDRCR